MPRFYALRTLFLRQSLGSRPTESLADVRCCALRALDGVATFEPCACVKVAPGWPLGLRWLVSSRQVAKFGAYS